MRIKRIQLEWFRGAAHQAVLEPEGKSVVVYGQNGSGKSSFVDALEYVLRGGKIDHLAHEYSGSRQEKAVPNTHKPPDQNAALFIRFKDGTEVAADIPHNGASLITGAETAGLDDWEYQRTILRQHEVSQFIWYRKGEKYSALLPLLGLTPLENVAENLRQLAKAVDEQAKIKQETAALEEIDSQRQEVFGEASDEQITEAIEELHGRYCPDTRETTDPLHQCQQLAEAIDQRISELNEDQRRHGLLKEASEVRLKEQIAEVRRANGEIASVTESLINEKLSVLDATDTFVAKIEEGTAHVDCPACGRPIPVEDFHDHVESEKERLRDIIDISKRRDTATGKLRSFIESLQRLLQKHELKLWRESQTEGHLPDAIAYLDRLDPEAFRKSCNEDALAELGAHLLPIIDEASESAKHAPPEAQKLYSDKSKVSVAQDTLKAATRREAVQRAQSLVAYIQTLEQKVREELGRQADRVIGTISKDVREMWSVLHPQAAIDNIRLSMPGDKAVDICLRFHGVEQDSPRLTLSEGYRNALGLCIFLAMAKREGAQDRPLFLDDVVVSMDRLHRGMVATLLEQEFDSRQVILLTHDRDWFAEMRQQLDAKKWRFNALLPYEDPKTGICWASGGNAFGDARQRLGDRPDTAGNDARKIMDTELAIVAEKLQIKLPFLRGHRNDQRTGHEFAERLASDGQKCFQKKVSGSYQVHQEAIDALQHADKLLVTWGNRASHTYDLVRAEAKELIDACENALACFVCECCEKKLWFLKADNGKMVQCECGAIRWRYK